MPQSIKYTGTQMRWPELAVTGRQAVWSPGQQEERSDTEAAALLATGQFARVPLPLTDAELLASRSLVAGAWNIAGPNSGLVVQDGVMYFNGRYCRELGLNAYSILTDLLDGTAPNNYREAIDGAVRMGVKIVRISMQMYDQAGITTYMHGGTVTMPHAWSDMAPAYRTAVQTVFDYAASKGVYLLPTLIWSKGAVAACFGEAWPGIATTDSAKARQYFQKFCGSFAREYRNHAALAGYVIANEPRLFGGTYITNAQCAVLVREMAKAVRAADPARAILGGHLDFVFSQLPTRPTLDTYITDFASINPDPVDTWDLHNYPDRAYIGDHQAQSTNLPQSPAYMRELTSRLAWEARQVGKVHVIGEFGFSRRVGSLGQETPGSTALLDQCMADIVASGCQLALLWNYRGGAAAQVDWNITEGTPRGDAYIAAITRWTEIMRAGNSQPRKHLSLSGTGVVPSSCATFSGAANVNIQYAGSANQNSAAMTLMFRMRKNGTPAAFARVLQANSASTEGYGVLFDGAGGEPYLFVQQTNGTSVNTAGKSDVVAPGVWAHYAWAWDSTDIQIFREGLWWDEKPLTAPYGPRAVGTPLYLGTSSSGANGSTVSLADVVLVPRKCTPAEVKDWVVYGALPAGATLIPLASDGVAVGAAAANPTSISGAVTFGSTGLA